VDTVFPVPKTTVVRSICPAGNQPALIYGHYVVGAVILPTASCPAGFNQRLPYHDKSVGQDRSFVKHVWVDIAKQVGVGGHPFPTRRGEEKVPRRDPLTKQTVPARRRRTQATCLHECNGLQGNGVARMTLRGRNYTLYW